MSKAKGPLMLSRFEPRRAGRMPAIEPFQAPHLAAQTIARHSSRPGLIAAFGQFTLQNPGVGELIAQTADTLEKGLQPEFSRYLELAPDEARLQLKAGSGWSGIWTDRVQFDAVTEAQDRFSIGTRETSLI